MRHAPTTSLVPAAFECASCGAVHNAADAKVPAGWATTGGNAWCGDCTRAGIPARELKSARHRRAA